MYSIQVSTPVRGTEEAKTDIEHSINSFHDSIHVNVWISVSVEGYYSYAALAQSCNLGRNQNMEVGVKVI